MVVAASSDKEGMITMMMDDEMLNLCADSAPLISYTHIMRRMIGPVTWNNVAQEETPKDGIAQIYGGLLSACGGTSPAQCTNLTDYRCDGNTYLSTSGGNTSWSECARFCDDNIGTTIGYGQFDSTHSVCYCGGNTSCPLFTPDPGFIQFMYNSGAEDCPTLTASPTQQPSTQPSNSPSGATGAPTSYPIFAPPPPDAPVEILGQGFVCGPEVTLVSTRHAMAASGADEEGTEREKQAGEELLSEIGRDYHRCKTCQNAALRA
ncbi:hypothetical protein VYU27_002479 [Nannochloropsis oceanica]